MDLGKISCAGFVFIVLSSRLEAHASSPDSWAELDANSAKACMAASGFRKAKVSASMHFSDVAGYDVRIVSGVYPQKHMKGAQGKMLCLYGRTTKSVEVLELIK